MLLYVFFLFYLANGDRLPQAILHTDATELLVERWEESFTSLKTVCELLSGYTPV